MTGFLIAVLPHAALVFFMVTFCVALVVSITPIKPVSPRYHPPSDAANRLKNNRQTPLRSDQSDNLRAAQKLVDAKSIGADFRPIKATPTEVPDTLDEWLAELQPRLPRRQPTDDGIH